MRGAQLMLQLLRACPPSFILREVIHPLLFQGIHEVPLHGTGMPRFDERALGQQRHVPDGPRASLIVYKAHSISADMAVW